MATNTFDIHEGMEVYSSDGQKIGKVNEVSSSGTGTMQSGDSSFGGTTATETRPSAIDTVEESSSYGSGTSGLGTIFTDRESMGEPDSSAHDTTRDPNDVSEAYGTAPTYGGSSAGMQGGSGYFKVSEGGVLGIGSKDLFVPFTAVETVAADGVVTLSYTKDEADNQFTHQPGEGTDSDSQWQSEGTNTTDTSRF